MPAPDPVLELVERFQRNRDHYKKSAYNETQTRVEFIDPLFEQLGWDIHNKQGYAEAYKDVIHEYSLKRGDTTKAPDYCFRIGGAPKFFLEAKKPAVALKDAQKEALQVRRYAWSAKLPLSILTDFEEFAVYDCRIKPAKSDKPGKARSIYITVDEYEKRWEEIADIFHKDQVLKGSFDEYAAKKSKRGTAEVDDAFLKDIEAWRETLAKNIHTKNPGLETWELNDAVQRTLDRIIFLRICEDRGIEDYGQLMALLNGPDTYNRLTTLFHRADDRYNSGLFHFRKEKGRDHFDNWTLGLTIADATLKDILKSLYPPESPYEFSVLPAEILGQVYEQFLGKVIIPKGRGVAIEDKPEVKKAGGVYYTPAYIVEYIVKHTVGKLVEGKTPEEVAGKSKKKGAHPIRVLDPACGSGSFLIGAYQFLLDWYRERYAEEPEKHTKGKQPKLFQAGENDYRLTTAERKRILLDHVYGVDIDTQAVEVTKLSLLLKVLEGESAESIGQNIALFHERALPDLAQNIKCGNSLIGPDFYRQQELQLTPEEERRINVFDWQHEFKEIFTGENPGFDAVIGNPPYVFAGTLGIEKYEKAYYKATYSSGEKKVNLFTLLLEKAIRVSNVGALTSFIIPNTFLRVTSYSSSREFVLEQAAIRSIADLGVGVFRGATTSSIVLLLERHESPLSNNIDIYAGIDKYLHSYPQEHFVKSGYVLNVSASPADLKIVQAMSDSSSTLGLFCRELIFGVVITKNLSEVVSNEYRDGYKRFLEGREIGRYRISWRGNYLNYDPNLLHRARTPAIFETNEKLLIQRITGGARPVAVAYDDQKFYNKESINNLILSADCSYSIKYILAVLNSKLINWFYRTEFTNNSTLTVNLSKEYLSQIPIRNLDLNNRAERGTHDRFVDLATSMLNLYKDAPNLKTQHDRNQLERRIAETDREIDRLVYNLYGLTEAEIKIVESATQ